MPNLVGLNPPNPNPKVNLPFFKRNLLIEASKFAEDALNVFSYLTPWYISNFSLLIGIFAISSEKYNTLILNILYRMLP